MIYSRKAGSVIILIISVFTKFSAQISLNEFLTLTEEQKIKLDIVSSQLKNYLWFLTIIVNFGIKV